MNTFNIGIASTVIVIASLLGGPTAGAAEPQRTINLRHVDAKTPAGAARIYRLITRAANELCDVAGSYGPSVTERRAAEQAQRCADAAIAAAVQRVNAAAHVDIERLAGVRAPEVPELANVPTGER